MQTKIGELDITDQFQCRRHQRIAAGDLGREA
jgi:hypothetical protein